MLDSNWGNVIVIEFSYCDEFEAYSGQGGYGVIIEMIFLEAKLIDKLQVIGHLND